MYESWSSKRVKEEERTKTKEWFTRKEEVEASLFREVTFKTTQKQNEEKKHDFLFLQKHLWLQRASFWVARFWVTAVMFSSWVVRITKETARLHTAKKTCIMRKQGMKCHHFQENFSYFSSFFSKSCRYLSSCIQSLPNFLYWNAHAATLCRDIHTHKTR